MGKKYLSFAQMMKCQKQIGNTLKNIYIKHVSVAILEPYLQHLDDKEKNDVIRRNWKKHRQEKNVYVGDAQTRETWDKYATDR